MMPEACYIVPMFVMPMMTNDGSATLVALAVEDFENEDGRLLTTVEFHYN